ncbi:glycosyltransferase [bacterium]|nr:glycosyltransferase [bacterium]
MKVALIHDWITGMRGGERCLEAFLRLYPEADIYTLVHEPGTTTEEIDARVRGTSLLQRFPRLRKRYRLFLPLFPVLARSVVVRDYDLVISLSHAAAKNVRIERCGYHICYCFTPMRYIWDMAPVYLGRWLSFLLSPLLFLLQRWDRRGATQVDHFVAISRFVASRIRKYYGRPSSVVYPPVDDQWGALPERAQPSGWDASHAFLYAGAFVPYKGVEHIIAAFNELKLPLWCVGSGPLRAGLEAQAGDHIEFFSGLSDAELGEVYRSARALVFPAREDFGIIPIEALLSGTPVIAGYHGATRESLPGLRSWLGEQWDRERHAAVFFRALSSLEERTLSDAETRKALQSRVAGAVREFLKVEDQVDPEVARRAGRRFSLQAFEDGWRQVLGDLGRSELCSRAARDGDSSGDRTTEPSSLRAGGM